VNLLGIDSVMCPQPRRLAAWDRLRKDLPAETVRAISLEAPLSEVPRLAAEILKGQVRGRVVVNPGS
jgi:acrylyl-CoA reductase (NADPH)